MSDITDWLLLMESFKFIQRFMSEIWQVTNTLCFAPEPDSQRNFTWRTLGEKLSHFQRKPICPTGKPETLAEENKPYILSVYHENHGCRKKLLAIILIIGAAIQMHVGKSMHSSALLCIWISKPQLVHLINEKKCRKIQLGIEALFILCISVCLISSAFISSYLTNQNVGHFVVKFSDRKSWIISGVWSFGTN